MSIRRIVSHRRRLVLPFLFAGAAMTAFHQNIARTHDGILLGAHATEGGAEITL